MKRLPSLCLFIAGLCIGHPAAAQSDYYRHVFFDNSRQTANYWQSTAAAATGTEPAGCESVGYGLRVRVEAVPHAAECHAHRVAVGARWQLGCADPARRFLPNRYPEMSGSTLYFWLYSPEPIAAANMPSVMLSDERSGLQVATMPGSFTVSDTAG